jgi:hypothetical protein
VSEFLPARLWTARELAVRPALLYGRATLCLVSQDGRGYGMQ